MSSPTNRPNLFAQGFEGAEELRRQGARCRELVQPELDRMREECDQRVAAMELTLKRAREVHAELLAISNSEVRQMRSLLESNLVAIEFVIESEAKGGMTAEKAESIKVIAKKLREYMRL